MSPNQIESLKERISFLSRTMFAYMAAIYLLIGMVGTHLMEWLEGDELVLREFGIVPAIAIVTIIVLALEVLRLRWKINRHIDEIGGAPCLKTST